MNQLFIKLFKRGEAVKCFIVYPDKRIRITWVVPKGKNVTIGQYTYMLNDKDFILHKGIPAYVFNTIVAEPINVMDIKKNEGMTPDDYNVGVSAEVARQIFEASKKGMDTATLSIIVSVATIAVVAVVAYLGNEKLTMIMDRLNLLTGFITGGY